MRCTTCNQERYARKYYFRMVWARHRVLVGEGRVSFWLGGLRASAWTSLRT